MFTVWSACRAHVSITSRSFCRRFARSLRTRQKKRNCFGGILSFHYELDLTEKSKSRLHKRQVYFPITLTCRSKNHAITRMHTHDDLDGPMDHYTNVREITTVNRTRLNHFCLYKLSSITSTNFQGLVTPRE